MKYDREWLANVKLAKSEGVFLHKSLLPEVPIQHRHILGQAVNAVEGRLFSNLEAGRGIGDEADQLAQLCSLAEDLIEEKKSHNDAYSSPVQGT